jgi:hypothetical protein
MDCFAAKFKISSLNGHVTGAVPLPLFVTCDRQSGSFNLQYKRLSHVAISLLPREIQLLPDPTKIIGDPACPEPKSKTNQLL